MGIFLVRATGLEPVRISPREPKARMSADSITLANIKAAIYISRAASPSVVRHWGFEPETDRL